MESTNIPQEFHQEQELQQPVESASSSSLHASTPHGNWYNGASRYGSSQFSWSPNNNPFINNVGNRIHQLYNTSRPPYTGENDHEDEEIHIPSWSKNTEYEHHQHQTLIPIPDQTSNKSKLDLFNSFMFPKFTDMISSSHSSIEDLQHLSPTSYLKTENHFQDSKLLRTNPALLSPSGQPQFPADVQFLSNLHDYSGYEGSSTSLPLLPSRGTFSQIFPSVNISNLNHTHLNSAVSSSPLEMNVQALDLLTSARFGDGVSHDQTQQSHVVGQQHLQLYEQRPTSSPDKLPSNVHGGSATYTKRPQTEPRTTKTSSKKSRTDQSRACPPFKVRKEKLGDRIAALQQLVAPFGKTDTASVLMEAIGYIKFLQNQVETLSVPYMKSSRTRCVKSSQTMGRADHGNLDQSRRDLRSRGLCLVPLSCMSYVTNDDGGGWPSSDYHGGEPKVDIPITIRTYGV